MVKKVELKGAAEMQRALSELGTQVATRIGVAANRKAAKALAEGVAIAAPRGLHPSHPELGHLADNIKVKKSKTRTPTRVRYVVHTGKAFWGHFVEYGTVKNPAHPFFRATWEHMREHLVAIQMAELRLGLERATRRLGRGGRVAPAPIIRDAVDRGPEIEDPIPTISEGI